MKISPYAPLLLSTLFSRHGVATASEFSSVTPSLQPSAAPSQLEEETTPSEYPSSTETISTDEAKKQFENEQPAPLTAILPSSRCIISQSYGDIDIQIDGEDFLPDTNIVGGTDLGFPEDHGMPTSEFLMFADFDELLNVKVHIVSSNESEQTIPVKVTMIDFDIAGATQYDSSLDGLAFRLEGEGSFAGDAFDGPCSLEFDFDMPTGIATIESNYCSNITKKDYDVLIDDAVKTLRQFETEYTNLTPDRAKALGMDKSFVENNTEKVKLEGGEIAKAAGKLAGLITSCKDDCTDVASMANAASQLLIKLAPLANFAYPGAGPVLEIAGSMGLVLSALLGERSDAPPPLTAKDIEDAAARAMRGVYAERDAIFEREFSERLKRHAKIYGETRACIRKYEADPGAVDSIIEGWYQTSFTLTSDNVLSGFTKLGEVYQTKFSSNENTPRKKFLDDQVNRDCRDECMGDLASGQFKEWNNGNFTQLSRLLFNPIGESGFEQCEKKRVTGENQWKDIKKAASSFLTTAHEVQLWGSVVTSILTKHSKNTYHGTIKKIQSELQHHGKRSFALKRLLNETIPSTCGEKQTNMWPFENQKCDDWDPRAPEQCNFPSLISLSKNLPAFSPKGIQEIQWHYYGDIDSKLGPDCSAYRNANGKDGFGSGMSIALSNDGHYNRAFPHGVDHCKDIVWWAKQFPKSGSLYAIQNFCMNAGDSCDALFKDDTNWGL